MRVSYTGTAANLRNAAIFVNGLDDNVSFGNQIRDHGRFDYSDWSGQRIERTIAAYRNEVTIKLWSFTSSSTNAATDPDHPHTIFYARGKTGRSVGRIVNTLVHEIIHNCDMFGDGDADLQMGHGDQSPTGKENSAPWWIGALAQRLYKAAKSISPDTDLDDEPFEEEFSIENGQPVEEPCIPLGELDTDDLLPGHTQKD